MEKVYKAGSIFRITKIYQNSIDDPIKNDFHVILNQVDKDKFILTTLNNGNRWYKRPMKGFNDVVPESEFRKYLQKTEVDEIVYLTHSSKIDWEKLAVLQ